jgi:hypothetical protein
MKPGILLGFILFAASPDHAPLAMFGATWRAQLEPA